MINYRYSPLFSRIALVFVCAALFFYNAIEPRAQSLNPQLVGSAGQYIDSKGVSHTVYVGRLQNSDDGSIDYFTLALPGPGVGQAPYPVIIFVNPYAVFPAPPSENPVDQLWNSIATQPPPYLDVSMPAEFRNPPCTNTQTGECSIPIFGIPPLNNIPLSAVDHNAQNPTSDWALTNGYGVAVVFTRYYAARGINTNIANVENVIEVLKSLPEIDRNRIGITGGSQGGQLSVHPLAMPNRPMSIAAAVPLYGVFDGRTWYDHFMVTLRDIQPPSSYEITFNGFLGILHRLGRSFGFDPSSSRWNPITVDSVSSVMNTPVLFLHGSDDAMSPAQESINLYNALRNKGKTANKWIYMNGVSDLTTVNERAHGTFDSVSPVKYTFLQRNFFLHHMPPDVLQVIYKNPQDIDLMAVFNDFRTTICAFPEEKANISGLMAQAANPKIKYENAGTLFAGPDAIAFVINTLWGLNWNASNVISNLNSGLLPVCGGPSYAQASYAPLYSQSSYAPSDPYSQSSYAPPYSQSGYTGNRTLTVSINGNGAVASQGVTCPPTCVVSLPSTAILTLTAVPGSGSTFIGWGGDCTPFGTGTTCSGDMTVNRNVIANFSGVAQSVPLPVSGPPPPSTGPLPVLGNAPISSQDSSDVFEGFTIQKIPKILSGLGCRFASFAMIMLVCCVIYVGIKFFISRGNPREFGQAKKNFYWTLVGGLVIYGVYTIILSSLALLEIPTNLPLIPLSCS